jgi:hypothetical protein
MSTLTVKLNGAMLTPGIFSAVSQHEITQRNYDSFPTQVVYTGLDDWTQVESDLRELVITIRDTATANQFTFEIS